MLPTDPPWLRRSDWAAGRVASNTRASMRFAWTFAILWNAVSAPLIVIVPRELARKPIAAIGFLFPIVGIGLLVWAMRLTMRWRRFGSAIFEMTPVPAIPGGTLRGTVHTRLDPPSGTNALVVSVTLTCVHRTVSHGAENHEVRETILWREEQDVSGDRMAFTPMGTAIPVQFSLPSDALETTTIDKSAGVLWSLGAEAELPGVDLSEEFDVPVYRTGDAQAVEGSTVVPNTPIPSEPVTTDRLARAGIDVDMTPRGTQYHFAAARNPSFAAGVSVFTLLWTGALWLQWYLEFPWIFIVVTALVEMLMLFIIADLWCGSTTVIIGSGAVQRRRSLLGIGAWRTIPFADISSVILNISMQTTGRAGTPYYEIRAMLKNGRRCALGDGIRKKRHAEWLASQMRTAIGLK